MSKVQAYQEAFRIHAAAQKAASDAVQEIYNISNAISNSLRSFMGWQFNMDIDRRQGRFDPKSQVDLDKWPSADQLKAVLSAWNDADTALRQAWEQIPDPERVGLTPPPSSVQLSASRY